MAESKIPVDLFNPGQVFACLGFMELADVLLGDAEAGFDWSDKANPVFRLKTKGTEEPVKAAISFVLDAQLRSISPSKENLNTMRWNVETRETSADEGFSFPLPDSPATLPVELSKDGKTFTVDHWGKGTGLDDVKFWAGSGGYPGAALWRDAVALVKEQAVTCASNPFALQMPQSSSFRFDWRRDYIPLDAGFSPNEHGDIEMVGYPLVELFATIGLAHARPQRPERRNKLIYRYGVVGNAIKDAELLAPPLLRAALGTYAMPFPQRIFRMNLDWPGQENQARCITTVTEELSK
jgi:CRISPR-associated protein Csx14